MSDVVGLLKLSELFAGLPEAKLQQIVSIGRVKTYRAQDVIISAGDPSDELYVVNHGMVEVLVSSGAVLDIASSPKLTAVVQLGQGQVFGEMALVDQGARSATVRCVEEGTRLFVLPRDSLWSLCEEDYHIGYVVMRNIARDLSFKLRHRNMPRSI